MATKKRLIDANVVLAKQFTAGLSDASGNYYGHADVVFVNDIENAPIVDAVEVVHGRWVDEFKGKYANPKYICSNCTLQALKKEKMDELGNWHTEQALTDYCPNCGAKMDGGVDNGG